MTTARIYQPTRNAMQSGNAKTDEWLLVFEPSGTRPVEPLMGWTSSDDTQTQVTLRFDTKEEAMAYAEKEGIPYQLSEPKKPRRRFMSYSDNFKWGRIGQWTH